LEASGFFDLGGWLRSCSQGGKAMPIDDLVRLLRDQDVGLWCKRAAWAIALISTVQAGFQLLGILIHGDLATMPIALLTTLLGYLATTLWYFFVLYALGAIVGHLFRA
jgi:hypothetical protein